MNLLDVEGVVLKVVGEIRDLFEDHIDEIIEIMERSEDPVSVAVAVKIGAVPDGVKAQVDISFVKERVKDSRVSFIKRQMDLFPDGETVEVAVCG